MIRAENKRISSIVVLCIASLQVIIVLARYFQSKTNLANPLIPEILIDRIRNFSLFMSVLYLSVVALNIAYLVWRKGFIVVVIFSSAILIGLALFGQKIHTAFITADL